MLAAALIERFDNHLLIVTSDPADVVPRTWHFPRGPVQSDEFAEAALRRIVGERLGVSVEIVVGQPPILCDVDGVETEVRYFFCGSPVGALDPACYAAVEWVSPARLRNYAFDAPSQPVVDWLVETAEGR